MKMHKKEHISLTVLLSGQRAVQAEAVRSTQLRRSDSGADGQHEVGAGEVPPA